MAKIGTHFWFADRAEEAASFYVSLFPDSHIDRIATMPADSPSGPAGSVVIVGFTLAGQPYVALQAGPLDPFNHAISMLVNCDDQAEIDWLWDALLDGGSPEQCGWLKDRYGLSWQIVPTRLAQMISDPDPARGKRVAEAMLQMVKLDIGALERAYAGE